MSLWSANYELANQPSKIGLVLTVVALGILAIITAIQFIVSFTVFGNLSVGGDALITGKVGVGIGIPEAKLHVVGDVIFEGNFTLKGTQFIQREDVMSEQLIITNDGSGPALIINQTGANDIVEIQQDGVPVFKIYDGASLSGVRVAVAGPVKAQTFISTSDYRLKENVSELVDSVDRVMKLSSKQYNFKDSPEISHEGFLAHEVQEIAPHSVTGKKDQVDESGNPVYQGVDYSSLVPLLTSALQQCIKRIEILERRLV